MRNLLLETIKETCSGAGAQGAIVRCDRLLRSAPMSNVPNSPVDGGPLTRVAPYPTSRLSPRFELVDLAREIQAADVAIGSAAHARLAVIVEQMRSLKAQAREVLEEARASMDLHRAKCNFQKL